MTPNAVNFDGKISMDGEKKVAVIVIGLDSGDVRVFDGEGRDADVGILDDENPLHGLRRVHHLYTLSTKTNPTCVWVHTPAGWRKVCY